ncbi:hypothetical protein SAMN04515647_3001 [Cohaesibacter sp. ES.047]|uniref:TIGR03862 family flavoprotein n=1 Tax=Cohaesibacter sp. ES.047 TaxID=1798205 RepID=UPI000BB6ADC0|nr:TIGR03862 family flavoprotein [Cohaesibacter sp. ES.047]SNY92731.1 hypothetical protein SAMN04515647_3001 [Cohaesibacter sp. ES.047]
MPHKPDGKTTNVAIVGAGAAGLMAADHLSALRPDLAVTLFDAMPSPARKILMAGKSGLNITHSEGLSDPARFAKRYGAHADWMAPMLDAFGAAEVVAWMSELGQESITGSSGRVFPTSMKASPLLRALMRRLEARGVTLVPRHRWRGWDETGQLVFSTGQDSPPSSVQADATLLALGGPSWSRLGTDGAFLPVLAELGLETSPYRPANCGFDVDWPEDFIDRWAGQPVKSVRLHFDGQSVPGDFVITRNGIEGGPVYALSAALRDQIEAKGEVQLVIDLRPNQSEDELVARLSRPRGKQSMANHLRKSAKLQTVETALHKLLTDRDVMSDPERLARSLKTLSLPLLRPRPLDEAISTAGGVSVDTLDDQLMVKARPGLFLAGEMLDWEAPTGGYLLTACLSQGYRAAKGIDDYLAKA